jgi:AraC family transcriptional regulator, regulatory protein of adaptative response / DNA-3-methyladenine glycosylase II
VTQEIEARTDRLAQCGGVRLPFQLPFCPDNLFGHLAATAVPGCEEVRDGAYRRSLRVPHGYAIVALSPESDHISCDIDVSDPRDMDAVVAACRWLLDLDADPAAIDRVLSADKVLRPLLAGAPGRRVPRSVDGFEMAVRAVLGQQVSTAAARTHAARLVASRGTPIHDQHGGLTHLFPDASALAGLVDGELALPAARRATLRALIDAVASGELCLDPDSDWQQARSQMAGLPGFGPWTIETVAMRALGDPDAFVATDLGVRAAVARLGLPSGSRLVAHAERWRPWRAYAVQYLWSVLDHPINRNIR